VSGPGGFAGSRPGRVAIVGAGQVGTMLGMALTGAGPRAGVDEVLLHDADPAVAERSLERGSGHRMTASMDDVLSADTIVLALPVGEIVRWLETFASSLGTGSLVLDTGSAKGGVVDVMRRTVPVRAHAVGGHPVAGTERPGPGGADPTRLHGATFVLCPVGDDPSAMARATAVAAAAGTTPVTMDAAEHDRVIARTSHLPHLTACAVATVAAGTGSENAVRLLASTGFAGATRLVAGDPGMIAAFLHANRDEVREALGALIQELGALGTALDDDDPAALRTAFAAGRAAREAVA
jgi:cyclohexadieny/prephenate dehydrogenase